MPAHRENQSVRGIQQPGFLRPTHHAVELRTARPGEPKTPPQVQPGAAHHGQLHPGAAGDLDRTFHVLDPPGGLAQKMVVDAGLRPVHRTVGGPVEAVVDIGRGAIPGGVVARHKHGVARQRPARAGVAVFGDHIQAVGLGVGGELRVKLEVGDVDVGRDLFLPVFAGVNRQHPGKVTARAFGHQVGHPVAHLHQHLAQVPHHTFGAAVGKHRNRGFIGQQDVHQNPLRAAGPAGSCAPASP